MKSLREKIVSLANSLPIMFTPHPSKAQKGLQDLAEAWSFFHTFSCGLELVKGYLFIPGIRPTPRPAEGGQLREPTLPLLPSHLDTMNAAGSDAVQK